MSVFRLPRVTINLMHAATRENDPFFDRLVSGFYAETRRRHRRFPVIRHWQYGVALCVLPKSFDEYFMSVEAAARRNFKKAARLGYVFDRIVHNDRLAGMTEIHQSAEIRQGRMPEKMLTRPVAANTDPASRTNIHDYPYFGILKDGKLVAYAGCMVSGELFMIEQIYGHAAHHSDGVVPMLIISMAKHILERYPNVKYYGYGTFYGAGTTLRRFKRKFLFLPHRVEWVKG